MSDIHLRPIGRVQSPIIDRSMAARQGDHDGVPECWLVFEPDMAPALDGVEPGLDIVIITWLHLADRDIRRVRPHADPQRHLRGVFATRSPDRPNPLGLHVTKVLAVDGLRVFVRNLEAVDGTPIVDIKPARDWRTY